MKAPKFRGSDRVLIKSGGFRGNEGVVVGFDSDSGEYHIRIKHAGYPEGHIHRVWLDESQLERVR